MDFLSNFLKNYFNSGGTASNIMEITLLIIGLYGLFKAGLFLIRYYIIYTLAKKLAELWRQFKAKKPKMRPTKKEDERLREERKERGQEQDGAESVEVERMEASAEQTIREEEAFKILMPKVTGKWQRLILNQRKDMIFEVARRMQQDKSLNYWQIFTQVQREREGLLKNQNSNRRG
jgi:hypothetical protein